MTYDKRWHQYKSSLADKGYFKVIILIKIVKFVIFKMFILWYGCTLQNLYEGSNGYKLLEEQAKQYYLSNVDEYLSSPSISQRIKTILDCVTENELSQLKNDITDLEPADDEKWLDVSPSDLDRILEQKFGLKNTSQSSASDMASSFTEKLRSFLNQASDINGAEFSKNHQRQVKINYRLYFDKFDTQFQTTQFPLISWNGILFFKNFIKSLFQVFGLS